MKYLVFILSFIVLFGAGCSSKETKNNISLTTTNNNIDKLSEVYKTASQDAGFHIYYPTYIPSEIAIDEKFVYSKDSASQILSKDPMNINLPSITVQQSPSKITDNTIQKRLTKLTSKETVDLTKQKATYGIYLSGNNKFYTLIFTTSDGVDIGLWSKTYTREGLIKIANSLK